MSIPSWLAASLMAASASARAADLGPAVAGAFYPADPAALRSSVEGYLAAASTVSLEGAWAGALVPHAGYDYSAATAAKVFRQLEGRSVATVIVLGTGHHVAIDGAAIAASGSYRTPLGSVAIDAGLAKWLMRLTPLIKEQPDAFAQEHSVEVELPFLQTVLPRARIVPLLMNTEDPESCRKIGDALAQVLKPGKVVLLVSSDLSHYPDEATALAVDSASLTGLLRFPDDPDLFWRTNRLLLQRGGPALVCTECGEAGLLAAQYAMKAIGARPSFLGYSNSGQLPGGDAGRVVGYGAVAWTLRPASAPPELSEAERRELLRLARKALEAKLGKNEDPPPGLWRDAAFDLPAAVFVTLRKKGVPESESLRGCIGGLKADLPLGEAVQAYAVRSALEDSRFSPVKAEELGDLSLEISRLTPFRPAASAEDVRPGQGVLLSQGAKSGLFLPQVWRDLPDKTAFLEELCEQKAGLARDCWKDKSTRFQVFDAEVFEE